VKISESVALEKDTMRRCLLLEEVQWRHLFSTCISDSLQLICHVQENEKLLMAQAESEFELATLASHSNHMQKIKYVEKIREEKEELKEVRVWR
jgi:hypothetical protein